VEVCVQDCPFDFAEEAFPLASSTLYNVGGPARLALLPRNEEEAEAAYVWMRGQPGPHLVLGGGSNVLIADEGFPGIVFFTNHLRTLDTVGEHRYAVGAGVDLQKLVRDVMLPANYQGVGALTGIPGSIGGAIYMNAGTVNGATCDYLESVSLLTPAGARTVAMEPGLYGYRGQRFCAPGDVILGGVFQFSVAEADQRAVYEHYMARRRATQPQGFCCGSVFKNPEGEHAGRLIEACGLKGTRRGGAVISDKHANFFMNEGNATAADLLELIAFAKGRVLEQFGVALEEEVRVIR
jgi:UDP-N-acetylmuramate dehydrogenase